MCWCTGMWQLVPAVGLSYLVSIEVFGLAVLFWEHLAHCAGVWNVQWDQRGWGQIVLTISHQLPCVLKRWSSREWRPRQGEAFSFHSLNFLLGLLFTPHHSSVFCFVWIWSSGVPRYKTGSKLFPGAPVLRVRPTLFLDMHVFRGLFFIFADTEPFPGAPAS